MPEGIRKPLADVFPGAFDGRACAQDAGGILVTRVLMTPDEKTLKIFLQMSQYLDDEVIEDLHDCIDMYLDHQIDVVLISDDSKPEGSGALTMDDEDREEALADLEQQKEAALMKAMAQQIPEDGHSEGSVLPDQEEGDLILFGREIKGLAGPVRTFAEEKKNVIVTGIVQSVSAVDTRDKSKKIITIPITNYEETLTVKCFMPAADYAARFEGRLHRTDTIKVKGTVKEDTYAKAFVLMANHITRMKDALEVDPAVREAAERMISGKPWTDERRPLQNLGYAGGEVTVIGKIISVEEKETRSGSMIAKIDLADDTGAFPARLTMDQEDYKEKKNRLKKGMALRARGVVTEDDYTREPTLVIHAAEPYEGPVGKVREDTAWKKRIELHAHTQFSEMDAVDAPGDLVAQAIRWGHEAVAITDHGVVQGFPDAQAAAKGRIKIIYGLEAYLVDDTRETVRKDTGGDWHAPFTVFDIETTGIRKQYDRIIEIGAVRIEDGVITDRFSRFVKPDIPIPASITQLTSITDEMVADADPIEVVMKDFLEWSKDTVFVAHNARFDTDFIRIWAERTGFGSPEHTIVDTLTMARGLYALKRYTLDSVAKHLNVSLEHHHRAVDDAECTAQIFLKMSKELEEQGIFRLAEVNDYIHAHTDFKKLRATHAILLVKNQTGLRNLYELVSIAHLQYFNRTPRIPKSEVTRLREGLLIGSACSSGELYEAVREMESDEEIKRIVDFYDYLEVQPVDIQRYLIRDPHEEDIQSEEDLRRINRDIVTLGETYGKPVAATGDVHFLEPEDEVYRRILLYGKGMKDADEQVPLYFRTTDEMLEAFSDLGTDKAREIVIDNPHRIADQIESIKPLPDGTYTPEIPNAIEDLKKLCYDKAHSMYGDPLPKVVEDRLERELTSIIKNGFSSLYMFAQKLVAKSNSDGYLVGSRGSVGSSLVATMAGITEVNPLPPHYYCKKCRYNEFDSEEIRSAQGKSGFDLPDKACPKCGEMLVKQGQEIPFETFLGFDGDKEPDIDLNFSGEYQPRAHAYTEELFGKSQVFRAGTIGTLAEKTAYGYVKKYVNEHHLSWNSAEINRMVAGCTGVKRTTGQHPGGQMIVPNGLSIYQFSPVQHPANDMSTDIVTTHFDYHQIKGRLLKMDILGHDDPTMIRMLEDLTGLDATDIPLDNREVMSLFLNTDALGVTPDEIGSKVGTFGIPEFGTNFVRQMLLDTKPKAFSDLVRISGLSHGTDVWNNNAKDLIDQGIVTISDCICTRDDIMTYLIRKDMEPLESFKIMESVRKGKGLTPEWEADMRAHDVPEWYIGSCKKIKYMFPKAHAAAYVTMSLRVAYYKVFYKEAYYAAYYTVRADGFDYEKMCMGLDRARDEIALIDQKDPKETTAKDKEVRTILELVVEMYCRGVDFVPIDLEKSHSTHFLITEDKKLLPPFNAISGMGITASESLTAAREEAPFATIEDLMARTKISRTLVDTMKKYGILQDLPETDQLSLF